MESDPEDGARGATKVYKPRGILLDFNGTLVPNKWDNDILPPFVRENLLSFLTASISDESIKGLIEALRQTSVDKRFKNNYHDCPFIPERPTDEAEKVIQRGEAMSNEEFAKLVHDYMIWEMNNSTESQINLDIQRKVWTKGLTDGKLKVPIFKDVTQAIRRWKEDGIRVHVIEVIDQQLLELFLKNTAEGDITKTIDGTCGKPTIVNKVQQDTYNKLSKMLGLACSDMLFITDYGQEARAAAKSKMDTVLIQRPGNKHIRESYRITYSVIDSLDQLLFIDRKR